MSNTLTLTLRDERDSIGLREETLKTIEERSGVECVRLQCQRTTVSEIQPAHLLSQLCAHQSVCLVKCPPHAVQKGNFSKPLETLSLGSPNCDELRLYDEVCRLRQHPEEYVSELERRRKALVGSTLWGADGAIRLAEGAGALDDAIVSLKRFASMRHNVTCCLYDGLCSAAQDLARDIGPKGLVLQRGTDESTVAQRVERYGDWNDEVSEIAVFGVRNEVDVICHTLINDGVPSRIHREQLLSADLCCVGVSIEAHATSSCVSVIVLARGFQQRSPEEMRSAREKVVSSGLRSLSCAYCFAAINPKRCSYGTQGKVFHKQCFMCKICKSTLRHFYFEHKSDDAVDALCKDCIQFRWPTKCCQCGIVIVQAQRTFTTEDKPTCEACFAAFTKQLTEEYVDNNIGEC